MFKKKLGVISILLCTFFLNGCGEIEAKQSVKELEVGQNIELTSLIDVEDGVDCKLVSSDVDINKVGIYTAEFQLTKGKKTKNITYEFSVVDTMPPQIICPDTISMFNDEKVDLLEFVLCVDNYDENVIESLVISKFEPNIQGIQNIELSVSDSSGNVTNEERKVCIIERNKPVEFVTYVYESIKNNLTYSTSFVPKSVKYKIVNDGYIYFVKHQNENSNDEMVDNIAYIKVLNDGSVIPWEEMTFEALQLMYWADIYNSSTSEEITISLEDIDKMIEDKKAVSESKWIVGIEDEIKVYENANVVSTELDKNLNEFNLKEIYSKKIDGIYYYRVNFTNKALLGTANNELYFKVDQSGKIIYYESDDGVVYPYWDSSFYWGIEYWENPTEEIYLNLDNMK